MILDFYYFNGSARRQVLNYGCLILKIQGIYFNLFWRSDPHEPVFQIFGRLYRGYGPVSICKKGQIIKRLTIPDCRVDNIIRVLRMVTGKMSRKNTGGGAMDIFLSTQLSVPILQIVMLLALSTMSLIFGRIRLALLINYCFTLYWGYVSNLSLFTGDDAFQIANFSFMYFGFGIAIIALAIAGLMYHRG